MTKFTVLINEQGSSNVANKNKHASKDFGGYKI